MQPKAQVVYRKLSELKELPGNPRTISKKQFETLKKSLEDNQDYFEARPIILSNRTGELVILAGNQRYKAAKSIGMESVPTILLEGLTKEREDEIVVRDNVENGDWDWDALANGWDAQDLMDWGVELPEMEATTEIIEDEAPEVNEKEPAKSKLGEIYQLGNHRLMVGDSTDASQVTELMGGELADLLVTDPPYNVNYANIKASVMKALHHRTDGKTITNDNFEDEEAFCSFLIDSLGAADANMKSGAAFYIWHADSQAKNFWRATEEIGWTVREILNWVKDRLSLGRQDYQWIHEPCLYGWKSGAGHYFVDIRTECTVFDDEKDPDEMTKTELKEAVKLMREASKLSIIREPKPTKSEEHPTMKPVKLIARLVGNSSRERESTRHLWRERDNNDRLRTARALLLHDGARSALR